MSKFAAMLAADPDQRLDFYLNTEDWHLMQKIDGRRLMLYCHDNGEILAMNRKGEPFSYPLGAIAEEMRAKYKGWWFDGEWLSADKYKVFDVLKTDAVDLGNCFFRDRAATFLSWGSADWHSPIAPVQLVDTNPAKQMHFERLGRENVEGVIFRHQYSKYRFGMRDVNSMVKWKFWKTIDVIAYNIGREGKNSIGVALVTDEGPLDVGAVTVQPNMLDTIKLGDVMEVKYLYATEGKRLYQPSLLRVRDDKDAIDCTIDQMRYTNKEVLTPDLEPGRQPASQTKTNGEP